MPRSLIVFSHLRWDFVYQRPQHLIQRLAQHYRIYFFEEPLADSDHTFLERSDPLPNLTVCRPHTPLAAAGFNDEQIPIVQTLVERLVESEKLDDYGVWFYSPMALPLMKPLDPAVVIYDCMDELSAFKNAPKQLLQREGALLKTAVLSLQVVLVFTRQSATAIRTCTVFQVASMRLILRLRATLRMSMS